MTLTRFAYYLPCLVTLEQTCRRSQISKHRVWVFRYIANIQVPGMHFLERVGNSDRLVVDEIQRFSIRRN